MEEEEVERLGFGGTILAARGCEVPTGHLSENDHPWTRAVPTVRNPPDRRRPQAGRKFPEKRAWSV